MGKTQKPLDERSYQNKIIEKVKQVHLTNQTPVIAACPSAGKTVMSLRIIKNYLQARPGGRVLVLAHGTTVLRDQFYESMGKHEEFSLIKSLSIKSEGKKDTQKAINDPSNKIIITLPQSVETCTNLDSFDFVVIDEAHERFFAKQNQKILKAVGHHKALPLTGTPGKFIANNKENPGKERFTIISVAMEELIDTEKPANSYIAPLRVEVCSSAYDIGYNEENKLNEVLESAVRREFDDNNKTVKSVDLFVEAMLKRLSAKHFMNFNINLTKNIPVLFKERDIKGMVIAKSIKQANRINECLNSKGYNSIVSHSEEGSKEEYNSIEEFKSGDYRFLVVVRRGILGFDFSNLNILVDISGSTNINVMYQAMARVVRKNGEQNKLYVKVAPKNQVEYTKHVVNAMLCLTKKEYIENYTGKNMDIKVPVLKEKKSSKTSEKTERRARRATLKPVSFGDLEVLSYLKDGRFKLDTGFDTVAYMSLRNIKSTFSGGSIAWTFEMIHEEALKYKTRAEFEKKSYKAYQAAGRVGIVDEVCSHMEAQLTSWTKKLIHEEALKHKTRIEFQKKSSKAYQAAKKRGILDEVCSHMEAQLTSWTKESIHKEALKHKTRKEFEKKSANAYGAARRMGVVDEVCSHMEAQYKTFEERLAELHAFIKENSKPPSKRSKDKKEKSLGMWLTSQRKHPKIIELKKKYTAKGPKS